MSLKDKLLNYADVREDLAFKNMTTLRIGGPVKYVVYPKDFISFESIIEILNNENVPFKVLGKGSNLLCSDDFYDGVVIKLDKYLDHSYFDETVVTAQAGCSIIALAHEAAKNSLSGLEWACGIPGTVGGCTFMNAGAYKACMSDILLEVLVYHDGKLEWLSKEACDFNYRASIFQKNLDWVVLAVKMQLIPGDMEKIYELMSERKARRMASQPLEFPSAGSVFRNPEGHQAWSLIDGIGYRGKRIGGAEVSTKHVNFIVNAGGATGSDFLTLATEIKEKVKEKYDVDLIMEVEKFNWK